MLTKKHLNLFPHLKLSLVVCFLLLGIFFRFANLETKVFWVDEVSTLVRISGYTTQELIAGLTAKNIFTLENLKQYQTINNARKFNDSFNAFKRSPEHAPLYFLLGRFWLQLWGSSIATIRTLSVLLSLLIFPCLYWLCQELFNKPLVSWLGVMLMSISPFFVAYAQEARPYSLWTAAILLMSASFLRTIRRNSWQSWLVYSLSLIIGFYTSLFSLFIAFGQGIYLLLLARKFKFKIISKYLLSLAIALLAFSPWILVIVNSLSLLEDNTSWMRINLDIANILAVWIGSILLIFGDLPIVPEANPIKIALLLLATVFLCIAIFRIVYSWHKFNSLIKKIIIAIGIIGIIFITSYLFFVSQVYLDRVTIIGAVVALFILSLSAYSLYFVIKYTAVSRSLYLVCLIVAVPIPLVLADIINQGQSSATPRYLIPLQLGIQIAAAYTLGSNLNTKTNITKRNFWKIITVFFLILGIYSCDRNLNLSPFYQKGRNVYNVPIANIINKERSPLVLAEPDTAMDILSLSYSLLPPVKFKIITESENYLDYFDRFSEVFVLKPSVELKQQLETNNKIDFIQVYQPQLFSDGEIYLELWAIKKNN